FLSLMSSQGRCTGGAVLSCDLGTIAPGASATISVITRPTTTGVVVNTAIVVGDEPEANTADNTATATTLVNGPFTPPPARPRSPNSPSCRSVSVAPRILTAGRRSGVNVRVHLGAQSVRRAHRRAA